eukprot:PITA_11577
MGTQLNFSTSYQPETDGQTERVNQVLEDMLRMYVMDQQNQWEKYLPLVEFAYNNSYHSSLQATPFEILYGRPCRTPLSWDRLEDRVMLGPEMLQEMEEQMATIKQRLKEARDRQKSYADAKRIDRNFKEAKFSLESNPLKVPLGWVSKEGVLQVEPLCILDQWVHRIRNCEFEQVKVQWDQYSPGSATWEDATVIFQDFPCLLD